jgi:hypothetical protein
MRSGDKGFYWKADSTFGHFCSSVRERWQLPLDVDLVFLYQDPQSHRDYTVQEAGDMEAFVECLEENPHASLVLRCTVKAKPKPPPEPALRQQTLEKAKPERVTVDWSSAARAKAPADRSKEQEEAKRSSPSCSSSSSSSSSSSAAGSAGSPMQIDCDDLPSGKDAKESKEMKEMIADKDGDVDMKPAAAAAPSKKKGAKRSSADADLPNGEAKKAKKLKAAAKRKVQRKARKGALDDAFKLHALLLEGRAPQGSKLSGCFPHYMGRFRVYYAELLAVWGKPAAESPLVNVCLLCPAASPGTRDRLLNLISLCRPLFPRVK